MSKDTEESTTIGLGELAKFVTVVGTHMDEKEYTTTQGLVLLMMMVRLVTVEVTDCEADAMKMVDELREPEHFAAIKAAVEMFREYKPGGKKGRKK